MADRLIQARLVIKGVEECVRIDFHEQEICKNVDEAFNSICSAAEERCSGCRIKRITYVDDEGDACTLTPSSVIDALTFVDDIDSISVLNLGVETSPDILATASQARQTQSATTSEGPEKTLENFQAQQILCDGCGKSSLQGGDQHKCQLCPNYNLCAECYRHSNQIHPEHMSWSLPNIVCDGCGKSSLFPGERHKCLSCPDYDLCDGCYSQSHHVHPEHNSWQQPDIFCDACGKHGLASNERHKCLECPDYDLCGECFKLHREVHPEHDSWKGSSVIICDGCGKYPLANGERHKCMSCPDYDLCNGCHERRHVIHPEHNSWRQPGIFCDGCGKCDLASEERHKCLECPDYDLCSTCYAQRNEVHPEHDTWKIPGGIFCDGCGKKPLRPGYRYKCTVCADFDLCTECHNLRHEIHPAGHSWSMPGIFCDGCGKRDLMVDDCHTCLLCPDYDLCADCYSRHSEIHPEHDSWKVPEKSMPRSKVDETECKAEVDGDSAPPHVETQAVPLLCSTWAEDEDETEVDGDEGRRGPVPLVPLFPRSAGGSWRVPMKSESPAEVDKMECKKKVDGDCAPLHVEAEVNEMECKTVVDGSSAGHRAMCAEALALLLNHASEEVRIATCHAVKEAAYVNSARESQPEVKDFVSLSSGDLSSDDEWEKYEEWEQV